MADPDIEDLLAHSGWARTLAANLARDPGLAEDILQETWMHALRRGPRDARALRAWLATLLRRRLRQARRGEERRARREAQHARALALPSTAEQVERAELDRNLVQAVLDLREPFRTTVLLRYLEELAPGEIAARLGIPEPTVHSRLARGLAALRARYRGEDPRSSRAGFLLALGLRPSRAARTALVRLRGALGLAAGLALLVSVAWLALSLGTSAARPAESVAHLRVEEQGTSGLAPEPRAAGAALPAAERVALSVAEPGPLLSGQVLDCAGSALADVEVGLESPEGRPLAGRARSAADGRFRLPAPPGGARLRATDARYETVLVGLYSPGRRAEIALVVAPRTSFTGRVTTPEGRPIPGARVDLRIDPGLAVGYLRALDFNRPGRWTRLADADGRFAFESAPALSEAWLDVTSPGYLRRLVALPADERSALAIVLRRPDRARTVRGLVLEADGRPASGALVAAAPARTRCDANGEFELVLWPAPAEARLVALQPGRGAAVRCVPRASDGAPAWPERIELELAARQEALSGRVLGRDGRPLAGARVWLADPTPVGVFPSGPLSAESLTADPLARPWDFVASDASGAFVLAGLMAREYRVRALDPATLGVVEARARPGEDLVLDLRAAPAPRSLRGRLVDGTGAGLGGVRLVVERTTLQVPLDEDGTMHTDGLTLAPLESAPDGSFVLPPCALDGTLLRLDSDSIQPVAFALADLDGNAAPLVVHRRRHLRVELEAPWNRADAFELRDGADRPLFVTQQREGCSHLYPRGWLAGGRSLVLTAAETARTLVFYREGLEIGRRPVFLGPGELNVLRW